MRASDYGPVALSRWKTERAQIFEALEAGRRVLVAHKGSVVGVIDPTPDLPRQVLAMFAMPQIDTKPYELTATVMNQERPAPKHWLDQARDGQPALVTRQGKLYGALRSIEPEEIAREQTSSLTTSEQLDAAIDQFLRDNPEASSEELADYTASLDETSPTPDEHVPYLDTLIGKKASQASREQAVEVMYRNSFSRLEDSVGADLEDVALAL